MFTGGLDVFASWRVARIVEIPDDSRLDLEMEEFAPALSNAPILGKINKELNITRI